MSELKERLDNLRALMQEPEFLEGKGLSNEVNIRIFCYDPSDEMMVRHFIEQIMTDQSMNCHLIEHNLYEVFLSICEDKRIAKTIPAMEEKKGKEFIRDQMSRMANNTAFVPPTDRGANIFCFLKTIQSMTVQVKLLHTDLQQILIGTLLVG